MIHLSLASRSTLVISLAAVCTAGLVFSIRLHAESFENAKQPEGVEHSAPPADPLTSLNEAFREAYAASRTRLLASSGPVIVVESDNLVLIHKGKRSEVKVAPDLYHTVKAISHVPLALYVMLLPFEGQALKTESIEALATYRDRIVKAEAALKDRELSAESLLRQREIIQSSLRFIATTLDKKQVTTDELRKFTHDLGDKLLANAREAAQAQLDGLDKQMKIWRAELADEEWKKLRVVVMGSALPRSSNLAVQYFAELLGEKGEGRRIVYAESLFDETRAMNLLGTHLLDRRIGSAFFNDDERMHRDLLGDAAQELLKKIHKQP